MEDQINNEEKGLTPKEELEQLAEEIRQERILFGKKTAEFLKRHKGGETIPKEEAALQAQHDKIIRGMEKNYAAMYKLVYPKGTKQEAINEGDPDMSKVHSMKSSVGGIVRQIPGGA